MLPVLQWLPVPCMGGVAGNGPPEKYCGGRDVHPGAGANAIFAPGSIYLEELP